MDTFLNILSQVFWLIVGLSILVTIHELGHFLPAKWFGMRVDKFYLFFDWPRKIFSFNWRGTEYGMGMLPLGGYVKIAGMIDESLDTEQMKKPVFSNEDIAHLKTPVDTEEMKPTSEPWEFRSKPVWQRAIVMVGGVTMNVILGVGLFIGIKYMYGDEKTPLSALPNGIYVQPGSPAEALKFKNGDKLLTFKGEPIKYLDDVATIKVLFEPDGYFEVERAGEPAAVRIDIPNDFMSRLSTFDSLNRSRSLIFQPPFGNQIKVPTMKELLAENPKAQPPLSHKIGLKDKDRILKIDSANITFFWQISDYLKDKKNQTVLLTVERDGQTLTLNAALDSTARIGVGFQPLETETFTYTFGQSVAKGTGVAFGAIGDNVQGMKKVAKGEANASENLAGPIKIAGFFAKAAAAGPQSFLALTAMLSMVLAFMNILPIPALDGGHLVFLAIEAVTGREPSDKVKLIAQYVGMVILLSLMVFIFGNDIWGLIKGK